MKCDNCPALRTDGYEYPEKYCAAGVPEDSKMCTDGGCRYPLKAILRRIERRDEMESHCYNGVEEWYEDAREHDEAMRCAIEEVFAENDVLLCVKTGIDKCYPYCGDLSERIRNKYDEAVDEIQKTYCERCRWRDRYQKCTACRRNLMRRDLFEEKKEAQG